MATRNKRKGFDKVVDEGSAAEPVCTKYAWDSIKLTQNSSANHELVNWAHHTSAPQIIKFKSNPLSLTYQVTEEIPEETGEHTTASFYAASVSTTKGRIAYMNSLLGAHMFFEKIWPVVDNNDLMEMIPLQNPFPGMYSYFMRIFCDSATRLKLWNIDHVVKDSSVLTQSSFDFPTDYTRALQTMTFHKTYRTSANKWYSKTISTFADGVPFLSNPRNYQVCQLLKLDYDEQNYFVLGPNTDFVVWARRHQKNEKMIQQVKIINNKALADYTAASVFSASAVTAEPYAYKVYLRDAQIDMLAQNLDTSIATHRELLSKTQSDTWTRVFDAPEVITQQIPSGVLGHGLKFFIPPATPMAYLAFVYEDNMYGANNHTQSYLVNQLANCERIAFKVGNEEAWFAGGLKLLDRTGRDKERFNNYLRERNWMDHDNPDYFPIDCQGYRCVFPLDFTLWNTATSKELKVELSFNGTGAPSKVLAVLVTVRTLRMGVKTDKAGHRNWFVEPVLDLHKKPPKANATSPAKKRRV